MLNSDNLCLDSPHGNIALSDSASIQATAIESIFVSPSEIALKTATSSAQIVAGYAAFSILQPVYIFPDSDILIPFFYYKRFKVFFSFNKYS